MSYSRNVLVSGVGPTVYMVEDAQLLPDRRAHNDP